MLANLNIGDLPEVESTLGERDFPRFFSTNEPRAHFLPRALACWHPDCVKPSYRNKSRNCRGNDAKNKKSRYAKDGC